MRSLPRFLSLAVVLTLAVTAVGAGAAAKPRADNAADSERLKYLPKDYWFVGELDVQTIMQFMSLANVQQNPQMAQVKQMMQMFEQYTGIDLETDINRVTLFAAGNPSEKPAPLFAAQGKFDNDTVAKKLSSAPGVSFTEKTHKNHKMLVSDEFAVSFPEKGTILAGNEELVRQGIEQADGKSRQLPPALKSVLERTPGDRLVWAAVRPQPLLEQKDLGAWLSTHSELAAALKKVECTSFFFDLSGDGLMVKGLGYAGSPDSAKSVHKFLSERKSDLLHKEGANVVVASLLIFSSVTNDGPFVEGSFRITGEAMKELWNTKFIVRPEKDNAGKGK